MAVADVVFSFGRPRERGKGPATRRSASAFLAFLCLTTARSLRRRLAALVSLGLLARAALVLVSVSVSVSGMIDCPSDFCVDEAVVAQILFRSNVFSTRNFYLFHSTLQIIFSPTISYYDISANAE